MGVSCACFQFFLLNGVNTTTALEMERKFKGLRKRLDQLGYRQPLGVESFPLVERLIADLLQTTESLKICKMQVTKNKEQKGLYYKQYTTQYVLVNIIYYYVL